MTNRIEPVDVGGLLTALQSRAALMREWQGLIRKFPVLICPVSGELPFAQQENVSSKCAFGAIMEAQMMQRALPALGLPGLTVSTGLIGKIPIGVQLVAGRYREDILLAAGADIESAGPRIKVADPV